jgi:ectoine hydroxylase-related dioxygenase (phytanoyl-CoA dioxygenase family)
VKATTKLSPGELDGWHSKGWALVRGFLDEERLAPLRQECEQLTRQTSLFEQRGAVPSSPRRTDRLDPVIDVSPVFRALAHEPVLLALLGEALGGEVQLLKDKYIAKPPGTNGYGLHLDGAYWLGLDLDLDRFASAMIFIDDATMDKGAVECADGWHPLAPASEAITDPPEGTVGPLMPVEASAGDLLLLHARTPHRSGCNRSAEPRRVLLFSYGVDERPGLYDRYQQHRRGMTQ